MKMIVSNLEDMDSDEQMTLGRALAGILFYYGDVSVGELDIRFEDE